MVIPSCFGRVGLGLSDAMYSRSPAPVLATFSTNGNIGFGGFDQGKRVVLRNLVLASLLVALGACAPGGFTTTDMLLPNPQSAREKVDIIIAQNKKYVTEAELEQCRSKIRVYNDFSFLSAGRSYRVDPNSRFWIDRRHTCARNFTLHTGSEDAARVAFLTYFTNATYLDGSGNAGSPRVRGCHFKIYDGKVTEIQEANDEVKVKLGNPCPHI